MKVGTIILHKNLSEEDKIAAIESGEPLLVTVINDYSETGKGQSVTFDMVRDHMLKGDTRSVASLIDVNNLASYYVSKNKIQIKIIKKDAFFSLSALQSPGPYDDSVSVENHKIKISIETLNSDVETDNKFDTSVFDIGINDPIAEDIKTSLLGKGVTITGVKWNSFSITGKCRLYFLAENRNTSFLGNNTTGFKITDINNKAKAK